MTGGDEVLRRAARYAACGPAQMPLLRRAMDLLLQEAPARSCTRVLPCRAEAGGARIGGRRVEGEALFRALEGFPRAVLACATLGQAADRLLARAQVQDMALALALDACASALVEEAALSALRGAAAGACTGEATAPGYAGFPLEGQQALLDLVDARRRLGVARTRAGMLAPAKTLLYVQGLHPGAPADPDATPGRVGPPCAACPRTDCPFRRAERNEHDKSEETTC